MNVSMTMKTCLFALFLFMTHPVWAQYNFAFQQEYFFGNLPSARTEAMGRANTAIGGSVSSIFFNPAGIGNIGDQEVAFSTSAPFYVLRESDYYFAGYARRLPHNLVAAVSVNQMAVGPTTFEVDINGVDYPLDKPTSTNWALTLAAEPIEGLHVGVNANLFRWKLFDDVSVNNALHLDAGALYRLALPSKGDCQQHLQLGLSVDNFSNASITYTSPRGDESTSDFPTVARVGAAYLVNTEITLPGAGTGDLDLTLTAEYQNVLNSEYRTGFNLGAEAAFWKVFALRIGFLTQNMYDYGNSENRDRQTDFTYGFGFIVPLIELTDETLPFDLHFDYVSLKAPPATYSGRRLPNMRTYGFRLVWPLAE